MGRHDHYNLGVGFAQNPSFNLSEVHAHNRITTPE